MNGFIPQYLIQDILTNSEKSSLKEWVVSKFRGMLGEKGPENLISSLPEDYSLSCGSRVVYDAEEKTVLPGRMVRAEGSEKHSDLVVNNAFDYSGATLDLLKEVLGRNSIDDKGYPIRSTVHFGKAYPNAFWNNSQIVFGDGDGEIFRNFCLLDIVGHELGHGVVSRTTNLVYKDQPGALNEHYADVFGICIKQRELNQEAKDANWIIGEGIFCDGINGVGIRSMKAPGTAYSDDKIGKDRQPDNMKDIYVGDEDNGGVHTNSGILNRIFYEYCVNVGGNSFTAPLKVWYEVLCTKLNPNSNFQDFVNSVQEVIIQNSGTGIEYKAFKEAAKVSGLVPLHPIFNQFKS